MYIWIKHLLYLISLAVTLQECEKWAAVSFLSPPPFTLYRCVSMVYVFFSPFPSPSPDNPGRWQSAVPWVCYQFLPIRRNLLLFSIFSQTFCCYFATDPTEQFSHNNSVHITLTSWLYIFETGGLGMQLRRLFSWAHCHTSIYPFSSAYPTPCHGAAV